MPSAQNKNRSQHVSNAYSNYVLFVLFLVYIFNFIDRQVLSILLIDIKADLGVSDTAMGFLTGFAFVVFYTFAGIPIARLADRASRRNVIAVGLVVWSSMTAVSGLAQNFVHLALARIGVGVGEAAGSPPAHSLISDYFPLERRATALSIYAAGVYLGVAAAYIGGGYIAESFGWRAVYFVLGLSGIPLALLVLGTVRELPRGHSEQAPVEVGLVSFGEVLRTVGRNRSFVFVMLATSVQALSGYAMLGWAPTFMIRVHEMSRLDVSLQLGIGVGVFGGLGAYLGGKLADRASLRDARWYMRLPAIEALLSVPFGLAFLLASDPDWAMVAFYPFYFLSAMYVGPMVSMIQSLVVPNMRAQASAINLFVVNMIGLGLGPLLVGFLNDTVFAEYDHLAIRSSLTVVALIGILATPLFYWASRNLREDLEAARSAASTAPIGGP